MVFNIVEKIIKTFLHVCICNNTWVQRTDTNYTEVVMY